MSQRPYIDKIANDTREYVESLLAENQRLNHAVAQLEVERNRSREALERALEELDGRTRSEIELRERISAVEVESRSFMARYVEVEQQNANLANLYVASYQLHGTLSRPRVLAAIKEIIINLVGSEELAIWEVDGERLVLADSFGIDADAWAAVPLDPASGIIGLVTATGSPFIAGQTEIRGAGREEELTAAIPLKLDDNVIGVIGVFRMLAQKPALEPVDHELFELLSSHAATALHCTRESALVEAV